MSTSEVTAIEIKGGRDKKNLLVIQPQVCYPWVTSNIRCHLVDLIYK